MQQKIQLLIPLLTNAELMNTMNTNSLLNYYFCMKPMYALLKLHNSYDFSICLLGGVLSAEDFIQFSE